MIIPYHTIGGRDLAAKFKCTCPSGLFIGTDIEHLMQQTIHIYGYDDANFFDNVNAQPRPLKCKCGKEYTQQWFRNGTVEVIEQ